MAQSKFWIKVVYSYCFQPVQPFILFLLAWIRIHKVAEYGSKLDPDPQHWFNCVVKIK